MVSPIYLSYAWELDLNPRKNHYKQKHNSRLSPRHAAKLKIKDIKRFSICILFVTQYLDQKPMHVIQ